MKPNTEREGVFYGREQVDESVSTTASDGVLLSACARIFTSLAVVLGLTARFTGLDTLTLAVDEYYYARAADLILANGFPAFATGGYYVHGPLAEYLTAASVSIFGPTGLGYRLPSVIFNVAAVWLFYFYVRRYFDRAPACVLSSILFVSSWQVEFARFARMYSVLQFMTLAYLLVFVKAFFDRHTRWTYATHGIGLLLVLTHELGLLLLPFLFLPLCLREIRIRFPHFRSVIIYAIVTLTTVSLCVWYSNVDFLHIGVTGALPDGHRPLDGSSLWFPVFPFWGISDDPFVTLALFLFLSVALVSVLSICRRTGIDIHDSDFLATVLLLSSLFHLFAVSILISLILIVRYDLFSTRVHPARLYLFVALALLISVFWISIALMSSQWLDAVPLSEGNRIEGLTRAFFGWPEFYTSVVKPWSRELPILGALVLLALVHQCVSRSRDSLGSMARHPAFVAVWIVVCLAVLKSIYTTTRYFFFIYPLILLVFALAVKELLSSNRFVNRAVSRRTNQLIAVFVVVVLFACTEDFNVHHLTRISDASVRFRTGEFRRHALTWYPRSDYATPAQFVNRLAAQYDNAKVIVAAEPPVSYYLEIPHAVYYPRDSRRFFNVSRVGGTVDLWSNQRLLSTEGELRDFTRDAKTVFVIRPTSYPAMFDARSTWSGRLSENVTVFRGLDQRIEVVILRLSAGSLESVL